MFHPVGSQPPNVYWRRRVLMLGSAVVLVVLIVITFSALASSGSGKADGQPAAGHSTSPVHHRTGRQSAPSEKISTSGPATRTSSTPHGSKTAPSTTGSGSGSPSTSNSAAPARCTASDLHVSALTGKTSYQVGDHPTVEMKVTNVGASPCVQDLADSQVLLTVYNGESRVWGSHDCAIQPGTTLRTLAVRAPIIVSMTWSGLTSTQGCKGTRQRVGAGSYTLYAALSGHTGTAAQFTIG